MAKIVVDAGHGGRDSGAVFQGRQERMIRSGWRWLWGKSWKGTGRRLCLPEQRMCIRPLLGKRR